ncbi:MAG: nucleotidyl transferase AbiEii/AbiGii toxin family protein [Deltaproteobacteria bacterium]|nr:nucleotidyl transferase AbiEii/AbiGii toxin family protein [Deltaproteobacteria bacterium]MBW2098805.1 nucleotidyl transferase AbiEii/AbiGii toxin family protein [Deltaproteobacteria bacterium]
MRNLIKQEQFELEVLDRLNSGRFLNRMVFGGGTMLRLCHGLDRYSVDLDFWLLPADDYSRWFADLQHYFVRFYDLRDAAEKFYTLIVELKSPDYPRSLKVEMRKNVNIAATEQAIAYSPFSSVQVFVRTIPLQDMMRSKIHALLQRKEIRDAYDLEFLVKKGLKADISPEKANQLLTAIDALTPHDYNVKLSSLLEADQRSYYRTNNFKILKAHLKLFSSRHA